MATATGPFRKAATSEPSSSEGRRAQLSTATAGWHVEVHSLMWPVPEVVEEGCGAEDVS